MPWKQQRRHILSNATQQRNENVLKMNWNGDNTFVIEWFAGVNYIILRSQKPVLPLR